MKQFSPFADHTQQYDEWYEKHPYVYESELAAIKQQMLKLPENISGIEVGLGTGRFAAPLGIKEGIEPVMNMAEIAASRGVEVMEGTAEKMPYRAMHFDFVLFVTICHLDNAEKAFREAHRVLKPGGTVIIGFIDQDQAVANSYEAKRNNSHFYKNAIFYSVDRVSTLLENAGFGDFEFTQTLFGNIEEIKEAQDPKEGHGEGGFVVLKAEKKTQ